MEEGAQSIYLIQSVACGAVVQTLTTPYVIQWDELCEPCHMVFIYEICYLLLDFNRKLPQTNI